VPPEKPDSGNIKITVSFLRNFQQSVLQPMVDDLTTNESVIELSRTKGGQALRLLAGNPEWLPAKELMDKYQGPSGTAPTLYAQIETMRTSLITLNANILQVVRIAESGEDEAIKLTTELTSTQLGSIFSTGGNTTGGGTGPGTNGPGTVPPPGS